MKSMSGLTAWAWLFCDFCLFHSEDSPSAPQTNAVGLKGATPHYLLVATFPIQSLLSIGIATPCPRLVTSLQDDSQSLGMISGHVPVPENTHCWQFHSASSGMCRQTQTCCLSPLVSPGSPWIHHSLDPTLHPLWPPVSSLDMLAPFSYLGCYLTFSVSLQSLPIFPRPSSLCVSMSTSQISSFLVEGHQSLDLVCVCVCVCVRALAHSVMSNSLWPCGSPS